MSVETESERIFEDHCNQRLVRFRRIPESSLREPDYELLLSSASVIAEVKQIDPNDHDVSPAQVAECQERGMGLAPSKRVQGLIASAYPQLKRYNERGLPGVLVAFNNAGLANYFDEHTVTKALFGTPQIHFSFNPAGGISWDGLGFGGGRKVTRDSCRSLSALCVLETGSKGVTKLLAYHNPYASLPLNPTLLAEVADYQYVYDDPHSDQRYNVPTPRLLQL